MRCRAILGMSLVLGLSTAVFGQAQPPPAGGGDDVGNLAHQLSERVRRLGEDISSDLVRPPAGLPFLQGIENLTRAVDDFHEVLHDERDPARIRRAYTAVDGPWHHLRTQLSRPGTSTPAVERAARQVDQLDARFHQVLGLDRNPLVDGAGRPAPVDNAQAQRRAHDLVGRAEDLAKAIRAEMADDPNGEALIRDAAELALAANAYHDSIDAAVDAKQPITVAAPTFGPVDQVARRLERRATNNRFPPRVRTALQAFAAVAGPIRQQLGTNPSRPEAPVRPAPGEGVRTPLAELATRLAQQAGDLARAAKPAAGAIPEGEFLLADADHFRAVVAAFQQDVGRGIGPADLDRGFREVDATWQRLAARLDRLGRGQGDPEMRQTGAIAATCQQIRRALGGPIPPPLPGGSPPHRPLQPEGPAERLAVAPPAPSGGGRTSPEAVAMAARGFGEAASHLQEAIGEVAGDSPLVAQLRGLAKSAGHLQDAAAQGEAGEHAIQDFRAVERDYARFAGALKKDHDVHHDEHVAADAKKLEAAFGQLRDQMTGRRGQ